MNQDIPAILDSKNFYFFGDVPEAEKWGLRIALAGGNVLDKMNDQVKCDLLLPG